jgi:hypothetical protein
MARCLSLNLKSRLRWNPIKEAIIEIPPVTQDFIDGLPTLADIEKNRVSRTSATTTFLAPSELTTYFFGKLIYESIGPQRVKEFCFYLARADASSQAIDFPTSTMGDPNHIFVSCPKWNASQDK